MVAYLNSTAMDAGPSVTSSMTAFAERSPAMDGEAVRGRRMSTPRFVVDAEPEMEEEAPDLLIRTARASTRLPRDSLIIDDILAEALSPRVSAAKEAHEVERGRRATLALAETSKAQENELCPSRASIRRVSLTLDDILAEALSPRVSAVKEANEATRVRRATLALPETSKAQEEDVARASRTSRASTRLARVSLTIDEILAEMLSPQVSVVKEANEAARVRRASLALAEMTKAQEETAGPTSARRQDTPRPVVTPRPVDTPRPVTPHSSLAAVAEPKAASTLPVRTPVADAEHEKPARVPSAGRLVSSEQASSLSATKPKPARATPKPAASSAGKSAADAKPKPARTPGAGRLAKQAVTPKPRVVPSKHPAGLAAAKPQPRTLTPRAALAKPVAELAPEPAAVTAQARTDGLLSADAGAGGGSPSQAWPVHVPALLLEATPLATTPQDNANSDGGCVIS
mmetsp:Transcript_13784/g.32841  ORF Transcript_13784/g.32841 Transcript_13784/m.32841 type:complete len:460 (+) Transcript_13784:30-1409(+)